ncbi:MAG: fructose-6-phosphate aldolase [Bacteroidota bacterium]
MFVIKVKGKNKIPDYIQLRDEGMALVAYFSIRPNRSIKNLDKYGLKGKEDQFLQLISELPYGKLKKLEL